MKKKNTLSFLVRFLFPPPPPTGEFSNYQGPKSLDGVSSTSYWRSVVDILDGKSCHIALTMAGSNSLG